MRLNRNLKTIVSDQRGTSTIEYGLILGLIVLALFAMLQAFAGQTVNMWNTVSSKSSAAISKS